MKQRILHGLLQRFHGKRMRGGFRIPRVFLLFAVMAALTPCVSFADVISDQLIAAGGNARQAETLLSASAEARAVIALALTDAETRRAADLLTGASFASVLNAQMQRMDVLNQTILDQLATPGMNRKCLTIWGAGYGGAGKTGTYTYTGYDYDLYGGVLGLEFSALGCANFGAYYSLGKSSLESAMDLGSTTVDTQDHTIGAYAKWNSFLLGGYTMVLGNYVFNDYETARAVLEEKYTGNFDGTQWGVYIEKGWNTDLLSFLRTNQFFALQYHEIGTDAFQENGTGLLALQKASMNYESLRLYLGARSRFDWGGWIQLSLNLTYIYEFMDEYPAGMTAFINGGENGDGSDFVMVTGRGLGDDWLNVGLGAKITIGGCISFMANYNCNWGDSIIHTGMGTLRFDF